MVSDSQLVDRLREFLTTADLTTTTTAAIRRQLEQEFGIDLTDKKAFIREQIDLYLENQQPKEDDNEGNEEEEQQQEEVEGEVEEDVEEDEETGNVKTSGSRKRKSKKENKEVKRKGGGFTKSCSLSPQLQKFIGESELARTEVVKRIWSYIREHDLQDPANRRSIRCDGALHELFEVDAIDMFQMNKALAKHIWPLNSDGAPVSAAPKEKQPKKEREEDEPKRKKRQKGSGGGGGGILAPIPLSEPLVNFLGTGESALARSDVVKRIWDYIKQNNLQDPSDKRRILCDEKLKELFDVETFHGFTVSKLLTPHFIKGER